MARPAARIHFAVRRDSGLVQASVADRETWRAVFASLGLGTDSHMTEPMYSTDNEGRDVGEPGSSRQDPEPADREPKPGNAPAPGQRPSESGSTPSDIPTEAGADAHEDHAGHRRGEPTDAT